MKTLLVIGLGSGIGGMLRHLLMLATNHVGLDFHIGTIIVNVLGCILLGFHLCLMISNFSIMVL